MIYIVSGPSCAGKSTLIASPEIAGFTGMPVPSTVIFDTSITATQESVTDNCIVHYNILRHAYKDIRSNPDQEFSGYYDFVLDDAWRRILSHPTPKCALILKVSRATLLERMSQRRHFESTTVISNILRGYPRQRWIGILEKIDLDRMYQAWCNELDVNGIPFILIDSSNKLYQVLSSKQAIQQGPIQHATAEYA